MSKGRALCSAAISLPLAFLSGCNSSANVTPTQAGAAYGGQLDRPEAPLNGTFTTIDDPYGTNGTTPWGLNAAGDIVGAYFDRKNVHGFLWHKGKFVTLDNPKAGHGRPGAFRPQGTYAFDINDSGAIVGAYINGSAVAHAFVLRDGIYHDFDEPNAGDSPGQGTAPNTINDRGDVVGNYGDSNNAWHGFLRRGHRYTTIDDPDAALTTGWDISAHGTISGEFYDSNFLNHGYLLHDGKFTTLDDPKAGHKGNGPDGQGTYTFRFTPQGGLVGFYVDSDNVSHGLLLCNGSYRTFDDPKASYGPHQGSQLNDIVRGGDGVGFYVDAKNATRGYLYTHGGNGTPERSCGEGGG